MHARPLLALLLSCGLAGGALATSAQAAPGAADDALVRLTGEVMRTSVETKGGAAFTALRVGDRFVPVTGAGVDDVPVGATATVDVAVPQVVTEAAETDGTSTITSLGGEDTRHDLGPDDLAAASDSSPAPSSSAIGRATRDAAFAPGASALSVDRLVTTRASTAAYTPATRRITYVEVTPRGMTRHPVTSAEATAQVAGADAYWRDQSRSDLKIAAPTIAPRYTSAYSCDTDPWVIWSEAMERTGWTGSANSSLVLSMPPAASDTYCGYGLGSIGDSPNSAGFVNVADRLHPVLTHEIGHNMSLGHANFLVCSGRSDAARSGSGWASGCFEDPYGDSLDNMGGAGSDEPHAPMLSSPHAIRTGMLSSAATVTAASGTTRVTLLPMSGRAGIRAAKVKDVSTGVTYYVEYRTPTGRDASNVWDMATGVRVLRVGPDQSSVLLDPTPTGGWDPDAVLTAGRTVTSYGGRVRVTTVSTSSTQAVVDISNNTALSTFTVKASPRISGTKGVGKTLTASTGSWSPTPSSYSYRWKRNGVAISGATGRTYTAKTADAGRYLTVTVTAKRSGYTSRAVTSGKVGIPIHATTRPYISGTPKVGRSSTVMVGSWTPTPTSYSYRWYRNGVAISGATAKTYTARSFDRGKRLQVEVIARRTGYSTGIVMTYSKTVQ